MRKIKIDTKIKNIKGEPLEREEPKAGVSDKVLREMRAYVVSGTEALKTKFLEWQEELKETKKVEQEVRDYLLVLLASKFKMESNKEGFYASDLGIQISNIKNKEIELNEDVYIFLKRIVEANKIVRVNPMGQEDEKELFYPFELGQLLPIFEEKEEKTKKEK